MNATLINQTTDLSQLVGVRLWKAGAYYIGPCPFCGGQDRFTIKHTPQGDRWFCRKCGDGKYHTVIDFIMLRDRVNFKSALERIEPNTARVEGPMKGDSPPYKFPLPDEAWQRTAWSFVDSAVNSLASAREGKMARDYLMMRGIHRGTWLAHRLGFARIFDPKIRCQRPAIVIPWWDCDSNRETITAIKYRFVGDATGGSRYISSRGSIPILYGLWSAIPEHSTLMLVEGELNALSIWQSQPEGVTCLSFGSETGGNIAILKKLVRRYRKLVVWADNGNKAAELQNALGRPGKALHSPMRGGTKWDANKMLQERILIEFLSTHLSASCLGSYGTPSNI